MQILYVARGQPDAWLIEGLGEMGHVVTAAPWDEDVRAEAEDGGYDLVVADMARPDPEGAADLLCGVVPVVIVADTADGAERAAALRAGADDCLTRPLHLIEVQTRLAALARAFDRPLGPAGAPADISLHAASRSLAVGDRRAELSGLEFRLVAYLMRREGRVVEASRLDIHLSGDAAEPRPERIRGIVSRVRRKFAREFGAGLVHAVPGHGYVFRRAPD